MLTLVVPIYNKEQYLPRCIDSLLAQTCGDYEILLIDDGSTDESADVVSEWARGRSNVRLVRKENGGPASARNVGLDLVRNAWVTFCDPDDAFHPLYFDRIAAFISRDVQQSAQMLTGRLVQFNDSSLRTSQGHLLNRKFIKDINSFYGTYQAGEDPNAKPPIGTFTTGDREA